MKKIYKAMIACVALGILSMIANDAQAQLIVQVGNGTATNGTFDTGPTPFGTYYHDDRTQLLFTAAELYANGAVPGQILSVGFEVASVGSPAMTNMNVSIAHSSNTSMTGFQTTGFTTVYTNSSYTPTTGWNDFTFTTPWNWNGTDNVIVEVCFDNNAYSSNSTTYYETTNSPMVYSYYCDSWCNNNGGCENASTSTFYAYTQRTNTRFGFLPPVQNDAGVVGIISPTLPTCDLDSVDVEILLGTFGTANLTSCDIKWQVNGGSVSTLNYTGNVPAIGGTDSVSLTTANFNNGDVITIWTENPNGIGAGPDSLSSNDTMSITLSTGLAGTYQIPGDYADFAAAHADLDQFGVCDTVIFNVAAGTYNEQVELIDYLGVSETSPIIFQGATGNPANVSLEFDCSSNASNDGVLNMNGARYIWFKDMTIDNLSNSFSYGRTIVIQSGAENLYWDNCIIHGSTYASTTTNNVVVDAYQQSYHNINFENSRIVGGSYAFRLYGNSSSHNTGIKIHNNEIDSFYYFGIYTYYNDSVTITHNQITSDWSYTSMRGIYMYDNDKQIDITHNQIYNNPNTGGNMYYPLYLGNCDGSLSDRIQITNNCVTSGNPNYTGFSYTFYLTNSGIMDVINNTITWITAPNATSGYVHYISGGGLITEKNNSFITTGSQYARYVTSGYSMIESDHNNFYTNGNNMHYLGGLFSTTEDFANSTGFDVNSVEVTADFTDTLACATCNDTLDGGGTPVAWVLDDINGETRSAQTPDIGATEFIAAGSFTLGPDTTYCADEWLLEAGPAQSVSWNVNGNASSSPTYTLDNTTGEPQTYNVSVNIVTNGCGPASDNLSVTLIPNAQLDSNEHICADETATLEPGGGNTATYMWSNGMMTQTIDVNEPGTYSVTKMEEGCESMATIVVTQSDAVEISDVEPCEDEAPISIDATINDGISYAWSGGSSSTTAINSFDVSDLYSVTVTDAFGCVSEDTFTVNILADPIAAISFLGTNGFGYFFNSQTSQNLSTSTTYNWLIDGTPYTVDNPYHAFPFSPTPQTYTVSLEIDNGCNVDETSLDIVVDPLAVAELANGETVSVFPNPATDVLNIQKEGNWEEATIELVDLSGRTIQATQVLDGTDLITINIDNVASGSYLLNIKQSEAVTTIPVIVK